MRFHQAYYGATPNGHDLLACDLAQRERFLGILDRTDLQGAPPAGVEVESYITAFRAGNDFFIMRTSPDRTATRGGMVFSHVFMTPMVLLGGLYSLSPVITSLKSERPQTMDISDVECCDSEIVPTQIYPTPDAIAMANALVAKRDRPVVWPAPGSFLDTIDILWRTAWPELRGYLTFTMALSSDDAHLKDYSILYVPPSEVHRWAGFRIIAKSDHATEPSIAATALIGGAENGALRDIAVQVSWPPKGLSNLEDLATLRTRLDRAVQNPREEIRSLRILCHLAPVPEAANALKLRVVARAQEALPRATIEDLLACRNLHLDAVSDSQPFWTSLRDRVRTLCETVGLKNSKLYGDFLIKAEKEQASSWRRAVEDGLRSAFSFSLETQAKNIWNWIEMSPDLAGVLLPLVPDTAGAEAILEAAMQATRFEAAVAQILSALVLKDMPHLRAKCLMTYLSPDAAFDWELSATAKESALLALCKLNSPHVVVIQCVRTAAAKLIPMAKAAIQNNASLLLGADLDSIGWRLILKSLKNCGVVFPKGDSFDRVQHQMLALISSDAPDNDLVSSLGSLGLFDLSTFADQVTIWKAIPSGMLSDFADASFDGTILRLSLGQLKVHQLVPQLSVRLADRMQVMAALRSMGSGREHQQLELFAVVDNLTEDDFQSWYSAVISTRQPLTSDIALRIGKLIAERRWKTAAEHIANDLLNYTRYDLHPILPSITPLLGVGLRFRLLFSGDVTNAQDFAPNDLWEYLESALAERFPSGPREHELWSRAKGSDADLLTSGSGRDQWKHALRLIRENTQDSPDLDALLYEAKWHYYSDPSLNWLYKNWRRLIHVGKGR